MAVKKTASKSKAKKSTVKNKSKKAGAKTKVSAKKSRKLSGSKTVAKKKTKSVTKNKIRSKSSVKAKSSPKRKIDNKAKNNSAAEFIPPHREDLNFIPEPNESHIVNSFEAHKAENIFHQHEEVAVHQENDKVKNALAVRKNQKRFFRSPGRK